MNTKFRKRDARIIGGFFVVAAVSAIIGLVLYGPILNDQNYMQNGVSHSNQIILGAVFELLLVSTAVGTGIAFFPYLRKYNEALALGYFCFRLLEAVFIMIGIVSILTLLSVSYDYVAHPDHLETYIVVAQALKSLHDWTFMLGPNFMLGINTFLYSYVLYVSGLVPGKLSMLGMISATLIFMAALLEIFGVIDQLSTVGFLMAFPIFLYEMSLAIWLIFKHEQ